MRLIIRILTTAILTCSLSSVVAEQKSVTSQTDITQSKPKNYNAIRADILSTITSINELRLIMINNELKGSGDGGNGKSVSRLTGNVSNNNKMLKKLTNESTSINLRLAMLEKATFIKLENNFSDYFTSTARKVFDVKLVQSRGDSLECDAVTDTYSYLLKNETGVSTYDFVETITRHDITGKICFERDVIKRKTADKLLYLSSQSKIYNDFPVDDMATYSKPVIILAATMAKGKAFGSGGTVTYRSSGSVNTLVYNKVSTLLNADAEVTLTVNSQEKNYQNCLIIGTRSNSTVSTGWYCPGDGLVKRITYYPGVSKKPARSEIIMLKEIEIL